MTLILMALYLIVFFTSLYLVFTFVRQKKWGMVCVYLIILALTIITIIIYVLVWENQQAQVIVVTYKNLKI